MAKNSKITAILALTLFFCGIVFVSMFSTSFAFGANNTIKYFNVTVLVSGNPAPNVTSIAITYATPVDGGTAYAYVLFNVTDDSGAADIVHANSEVNITKGGVTLTSTVCVEYVAWTGGIQKGINCTVPIQYYRDSGDWNITAYAEDTGALSDTNVNDSTLTYYQLYAFQIDKVDINFTGAPGASSFGSLNDPLTLNNTGNGNFASIDITAYALNGPSSATIGPGNFTANTADSAGTQLSSTGVNIPTASLSYGAAATEQFWFYLSIPGGLPQGQYNSSQQWEVEAYN